MKPDSVLQQDVLDELAWTPGIDSAAIGVAVEDGVVMLSGHVSSFAEKWSAERATKRVAGVRAVANELAIRLHDASVRSDSDIARAALNALEWDAGSPERRIVVTVSDGWVKLDGTADTQHQKLAAERVVGALKGVRSVTNVIKVAPTAQPLNIQDKIERAFQRSAILDARQIRVEVHDGTIVLRGSVRSWDERETAEQAAWAAPGVTEVENHIMVQSTLLCKERLAEYFRNNLIPFETQRHRMAYTAQDVAASEHLPGQMMAKVVIAIADGAMVMLVLPADHRVDLDKASAELVAREVWLAEERDFANIFPDCEVGAMPPFGNLYDLPVYVDQLLTEDETIVFQAGAHSDTMQIAYADFARLVKPMVVDIARVAQLAAGRY